MSENTETAPEHANGDAALKSEATPSLNGSTTDPDQQESTENEGTESLPEPIPESIPEPEQNNQDAPQLNEDEQEDIADAEQHDSLPSAIPKIITTSDTDVQQQHVPIGRHSRAASLISNASIASRNSTHISFVKSFITSITEHKDGKKLVPLINSAKKTLDKLNSSGFDSLTVFETLRLAIESKVTDIVILSLDCFSKIFTFQLFDEITVPLSKSSTAPFNNDIEVDQLETNNANQINPPQSVKLIDAAIETIASSFDGEGTDARIEVQVVRALLSAVLNEQFPPHGSTLLRAVRQIYNIFILSLSPSNQGIAQASLTQVVNVVFDKVEKIPQLKFSNSSRIPSSSAIRKSTTSLNNEDSKPALDSAVPNDSDQAPLTLQNLNDLNYDEERIVDQEDLDDSDESDLVIKDAFLLFRAMCKLSVKSLDNDSLDMRSHTVRSKLISLHIIHSIIKEHIDVFTSNQVSIKSSSKDNTKFVDAVRQYLCLTIARNAASAISPVFETTLEIFWLIVSNLRSQFKREIPVFLNEIYFPVAELKTSTSHQKRYFLVIVQRLSNDPRALIEFYLNYDCDSNQPNIVEKLIDYLTKLALTKVEITPRQKVAYKEDAAKSIATYNLFQLPLLSISKLSSLRENDSLPFPIEYSLKITALNSVVGILRSLNSWAQKGISQELGTRSSSTSVLQTRKRSSTTGSSTHTPLNNGFNASLDEVDDPQEFENLKLRKTALQEGIRQFNFKPKKGINHLIKEGFIKEHTPAAIAKFVLEQPGLDKAQIGEYLGDGDEFNIATMHQFVDFMDFKGLTFVDAMRMFLQSFRLPGEAQKIDRFMLKFAERYVDGNPGAFANADTAYVLAYSVIMLNTDQHSSKVKNRMTLDDFIKNNRGIDDGQDLSPEYLSVVFGEIANNEIKLQSEQHAALLAGENVLGQQQLPAFGFFNGNRDYNREAYIQASKEISNKTEKLFKTLGKNKNSNDSIYYSASHIEHVKSIFDTLWMSFLAVLTRPFTDLDDEDTIKTCLEGLKLSISISTIFELDYSRTSFIGALVQFTNLGNVKELKVKNIEAVVLLLRIAELYGDQLKESWKDILTVISQIERLQLIAKGVEADILPDVVNARVHRASLDSQRTTNTNNSGYFFGFGKKATLTEQAQTNHQNQHLNPEIGAKLLSTEVIVSIDKIFTQSSQLNANGILDFISALTEVANEEIESSLDSNTPRTFSLQKVIDVCYYNMGRIRLEWSPIWTIIGGCFNDIGTKHNLSIVFFAIDSLRQLSTRFLDIEELTGFKFQEEFLKPFYYILKNSKDQQVTEMVLSNLDNLIQLKGYKIKSGWKSIFAVLSYTAKDGNQATVERTYEIIDSIYRDYSEVIFSIDDAFNEFIHVLKELSMNSKFQKISLHTLQKIKMIIVKIANLTFDEGDELKNSNKDVFQDFWYPALSSFNQVIMKGDDLEIRSRALNFLFDILVQFGNRFDEKFWDKICVNLLFPIFGVLSKHWEINQFNSHDDLSVWLSTTLIQALRNMIALFTHYFSVLSKMLDGYLGLLISCICQENDTIARIGRSCLQQLISQNMKSFSDEHWDKIVEAFEKLFEFTTPKELFDSDPLKDKASFSNGNGDTPKELDGSNGVDFGHSDQDEGEEEPTEVAKPVVTPHKDAKKPNVKVKDSIVVKCILQLLMIETLSELFEDDEFYELIQYKHLNRLTSLLEKSFRFARNFNDDLDLRTRLWNSGVIDKLPNLLKQESSSAAVFININFQIYSDKSKVTPKEKDLISTSLIPMCVSIVERYVQLDDSTQQRNVITWRPVVVEILQGYCELEQADFSKNCPHVYDLVLNILDKSVPAELRTAIKAFFARVGDVYIEG
jgi:brefeldin A-inhibited guanine nucleotide-exchange protein